MNQHDDDADDESRPTTALNRDELLGLVAQAREVNATEGVAPIVMIVNRPQEVVDNAALQRAIETRMMQPIELESMGYAPLVEEKPAKKVAIGTKRLPRAATGVAVTAPKTSPYLYVWVAACLLAAIALILLAP